MNKQLEVTLKGLDARSPRAFKVRNLELKKRPTWSPVQALQRYLWHGPMRTLRSFIQVRMTAEV